MRNLDNLSKEETTELKEVLSKCRQCDCVVSLKQFIDNPNGGKNELVLQQNVCETNNVIYINGNYLYLSLTSATKNNTGLTKIRSFWETVLRRGTARIQEGRPNDYSLFIDLLCSEYDKGKIYIISTVDPIFVTMEEKSLSLVFSLDDFCFGKENLTRDEVEYESALQEGRDTNIFVTDDEEEYEEEVSQILDTEETARDILDTSDYTTGM